jgi:hypothetical protein
MDQASEMVVLSAENYDIYLQGKASGTKSLLSGEAVRDYKRNWKPCDLGFLADAS